MERVRTQMVFCGICRNYTSNPFSLTSRILALFAVVLSLNLHAQQPISLIKTTTNSVATGTSYTATGAAGGAYPTTSFTYRFGNASGFTNNKVFLNTFVAGTATYAFEYGYSIKVVLKRVYNAQVSGNRDLIFNEGNITNNPSQAIVNSPYVPSMATLFAGNDDLRSGTDNLFGNQGDGNGNNNNIERLDVLVNNTKGYLVGNPNLEGFAVFERGAVNSHDPFVVAVITALDGSGNPSAYTTVRRITSANYGDPSGISSTNYLVMRRDNGTGNLQVSALITPQGLGGVFFRFADFGISAGTRIYGYSLAGADFPATAPGSALVDVNNATNFPTNTVSTVNTGIAAGGLDFSAITGVFKTFNNDLDSYANDVDIDDDNDGVPDLVENGGSIDAFGDADIDGVLNYVDQTPGSGVPVFTDANEDGVNDAYDADKDGRVNQIDLDSDNDGIPDLVEAGGVDTNGDGVIDVTADTDTDGLINPYDAGTGGVNIANLDTDGDGIRNFLDLDSDNDGIPDVAEAGGADQNGDGRLDNYNDSDSDGLDDTVDSDVGNDGTVENASGVLLKTGTDTNTDGRPDAYPYGIPNTDGHSMPNPYDLDADNDGIADLIEVGGADSDNNGKVDVFADADKDGFADARDGDVGNDGVAENTAKSLLPTGPDSDNNGHADAYPHANADGEGRSNPYDLDSDGDGIPDLVEAGGVDTNGDGMVDVKTDTDNDGLMDPYDTSNGANPRGVAIGALDTDGDGIANVFDLDSDNDGIPDVLEAGGTDANNDGRPEGFVDVDGDGFADLVDGDVGNDGTTENLVNALIPTGADTNNDSFPDGYAKADLDGKGGANPYDLDADGDGILDAREGGIPDSDNNGIANGTLGADGWSDTVDGMLSMSTVNTDGTGSADYLDIDSDDDGITDNVEGQSTEGYKLPSGVDSDKDGIDDAYDNNTAVFSGNSLNGIVPNNADEIDLPDYRDTDADNDGMSDQVEGHDFNLNGSADDDVSPSGLDTDGDGLDDKYDLINSAAVVTNEGMITGGLKGSPAMPGARGPLQKRNNVNPDRDWRFNMQALPVRFISITAVSLSSGNQIRWVVAEEQDVLHYEVERSMDGKRYEKAGTVVFKMPAALSNSYEYLDEGSQTSVVYYRIRQVDRDGKATYSGVVVIQRSNSIKGISVYPNPVQVQSVLRIDAEKTQKTLVCIADVQGRILSTFQLVVQKGQNVYPLSLIQQLPSGEYIILIEADGKKQQVKIFR